MDAYDIRHGKKDLEFLATKVVHYQHHFKFLEAWLPVLSVCSSLSADPRKNIQLKSIEMLFVIL